MRPNVLDGTTTRYDTNAGTAFITVNRLDGAPVEVIVRIGRVGSTAGELAEAVGRLATLYLTTADDQMSAARDVVDELSGIGLSYYAEWARKSVPDAVAAALEREINDRGDTGASRYG